MLPTTAKIAGKYFDEESFRGLSTENSFGEIDTQLKLLQEYSTSYRIQ